MSDQKDGAVKLCDNCGRSPAVDVCFVAAIGRLIYHKEEFYSGMWCKVCGIVVYNQVMKRHIKNTWLSPTAFVFGTTIGTAKNLLERRKLEALHDPAPMLSPTTWSHP